MKPACAQSTDAYANPGGQLPLPVTVAEIGKIHFEGNIIPHRWYQRILLDSGKPNLPAITILAEIIYWYRPYQILDKKGQPLLRKHFDGDMFQCSAAYFQAKFGLTKDQTRKALKRLEDGGYIRREYRDIVQQGILRNNIMFIEPLPLAIIAITHPAAPPKTPPPEPGTLSPTGDTLSPVGDFFKGIKITTETTTEISTETTTTTPNPSSSTERAVAPEPACGSRGAQDEQPQDQDGNPEAAKQEPTEEQPVSQEERQAAPALEDRSDTPIETPKTVNQEEGQTAPTLKASSDTPTETPKTVASEEGVNAQQPECNAEGVNTPQPELNAEGMNVPQPELTDPTAAPAATLAEVAYPDAQNTAQKGPEGAIQWEPHLPPSPALAEPLAALQADLTGVVRAAETTPDTPSSPVYLARVGVRIPS